MAGSQHFSPGDIQFKLVYDRGQCASPVTLKYDFSELDDSGNYIIRNTCCIVFDMKGNVD